MWKSVRRAIDVIVGGFLWLVVLVPILGVSAYSLYYIGRYLGAPWFIAIAFSTCFDGVALFAARKSVDYAQAGLSGSFPKFVVRLFAFTAAFLQTLHARIDHELPGSWIMWAALPIGAMVVYEIHIRWEKRKALARAGSIYPSPLPSFGVMAWLLFPLSTLGKLRDITIARRDALVAAATTVVNDFRREADRVRNTRERVSEPAPAPQEAADPAVVEPESVLREHREHREQRRASGYSDTRTRHSGSQSPHSPVRHIRDWLRNQPEWKDRVGTHGRILPEGVDAYYAAHPDEERSG